MADSTLRFLPRRAKYLKAALKHGGRPLGEKMHEIATRSPKDLAAFDAMADLVLERLDRLKKVGSG